jgi:putative addiction module killer protein
VGGGEVNFSTSGSFDRATKFHDVVEFPVHDGSSDGGNVVVQTASIAAQRTSAYGVDEMPGPIDKSPVVLYEGQIVVVETEQFRNWLDRLRDGKARVRIDDRLRRLASGNVGDTKSVGDGVQELRLHFGPGYRIYYVWRDGVLIILLCGGDKSSQARDIAKAKELAKEADDGIEGLPI